MPSDRPFVFCHMLTSLDGKISGDYMSTPEGGIAGEVFDRIAFGTHPFYKHQGWLSGRITTDENFTFYEKPDLDPDAPAVPEGDSVFKPEAGEQAVYYVSVDPSGRLGWKSNVLPYGGVHARVLEVLTERASNAYKAFLRRLGIPYVIAGSDKLDRNLLLCKLRSLFDIKTLMLGGGGVLNWSFVEAGLCDEVSIVVAAAADGSSDTPTLFEALGGFAAPRAVRFALIDAKAEAGGALWLRYRTVQKSA